MKTKSKNITVHFSDETHAKLSMLAAQLERSKGFFIKKAVDQFLNILPDTILYCVSNEAMYFAIESHKSQKRKYTNNPYWNHLSEVAGMISTMYTSPDVVAVAWLHDIIEDTEVTYNDLLDRFGIKIANGVLALSDLEVGNRAERKLASRERLSLQPKWIQDIKVCDMISNTCSIMLHDPKFAETYILEKKMLLNVLTKADEKLLWLANLMIKN